MSVIRLWFCRATEKARLYCKVPPERNSKDEADYVWVPISITEGTTKYPSGEHHVKLPDWFIEKEGL